jgi:uncharacterized protein YecE (DUF72 family)
MCYLGTDMITVGCQGFAVSATRYFKEYTFVEVQDTHRGPPGRGTIRRWQREAPPGFRYALLAPKEIAEEGFRDGKIVETSLDRLEEVARELGTVRAVFAANPDFASNRGNIQALEAFLKRARERFDEVIFDPGPLWRRDDADRIAEVTGTLAARDPLEHGPSEREQAYYRLPGPAGHKSRYEDPAIERLAEIAEANADQQADYVFGNVDMFTDGKRLKRALGL